MELQEIIELNGEVITEDIFTELIESDLVTNYEHCGCSGRIIGKQLYSFLLVDGTEIEILL